MPRKGTAVETVDDNPDQEMQAYFEGKGAAEESPPSAPPPEAPPPAAPAPVAPPAAPVAPGWLTEQIPEELRGKLPESLRGLSIADYIERTAKSIGNELAAYQERNKREAELFAERTLNARLARELSEARKAPPAPTTTPAAVDPLTGFPYDPETDLYNRPREYTAAVVELAEARSKGANQAVVKQLEERLSVAETALEENRVERAWTTAQQMRQIPLEQWRAASVSMGRVIMDKGYDPTDYRSYVAVFDEAAQMARQDAEQRYRAFYPQAPAPPPRPTIAPPPVGTAVSTTPNTPQVAAAPKLPKHVEAALRRQVSLWNNANPDNKISIEELMAEASGDLEGMAMMAGMGSL